MSIHSVTNVVVSPAGRALPVTAWPTGALSLSVLMEAAVILTLRVNHSVSVRGLTPVSDASSQSIHAMVEYVTMEGTVWSVPSDYLLV